MSCCRKKTQNPRIETDAGVLLIALLAQTVLLVEAADTPAGIEHLLLTGEEGVALGTNFHTDILLGGAGRIDSTASAADGGLLIIRMDSFLHD